MKNFAAVSKAGWLEKISKELKNRPLEELDIDVAHGVHASPFAHADDFAEGRPSPIFFENAGKNGWQIGEKIEADLPNNANRTALAALAGGAEALDFSFEKMPPDEAHFLQIFDRVFLDMISTEFSGEAVRRSPSAFLGHFARLAESKNLNEMALCGSLDFDPTRDLGKRPDWRFLADLVSFSAQKMPFFRTMTLQADESDLAKSLSDLLKKANLIVQKLAEKGISFRQVIGSMQFKIAVGPNFLTEISRLRAFQILWLNFQKAWADDGPLIAPRIVAVFDRKSYVEDPNQNMIRATEMALAAAIGGAAQVFVAPFSNQKTGSETEAFHRRIAQNIQHILKSESFIARVEDPTAGAYFIEKLTAKLAEKAWTDFGKAKMPASRRDSHQV